MLLFCVFLQNSSSSSLVSSSTSHRGGTTFAWNNVILPRSSSSLESENDEAGNSLHRAHYDVRHLAPGANYEAQVQAKNKFGWSERSESVKFTANTRPSHTPATIGDIEDDDEGRPKSITFHLNSVNSALIMLRPRLYSTRSKSTRREVCRESIG